MKNFCYLILLIFSVGFTQEKNNFLETLWGEYPKTGITYMPVGTHTYGSKIHKPHETHYIGYNYKFLEIATFINSYHDWSISAMYKRMIPIGKRWSINYGGGIVYGYDGRLQDQQGIPFKKVLFSGPFNPIFGGGVNFKISDRWLVSVIIAPQINLYGLKYLL